MQDVPRALILYNRYILDGMPTIVYADVGLELDPLAMISMTKDVGTTPTYDQF